VASAGDDGSVKVWEAATGRPAPSPPGGHEGSAAAVAFNPRDGSVLASGGKDKKVRVWDAKSGRVLELNHGLRVWSVAFSPDGKYVASAGGDETVKLWVAATGELVADLSGNRNRQIFSVAFGGSRLAAGDWAGTVTIWDVESRRQERSFLAHPGWVNGLSFSPDGRRLASAGDDGVVKVWDAADGEEALVLTEYADSVAGVAFSGDGRYLAAGGKDGSVKVWDAAPLEERKVCPKAP
jgi:WD40 repeat protein